MKRAIIVLLVLFAVGIVLQPQVSIPTKKALIPYIRLYLPDFGIYDLIPSNAGLEDYLIIDHYLYVIIRTEAVNDTIYVVKCDTISQKAEIILQYSREDPLVVLNLSSSDVSGYSSTLNHENFIIKAMYSATLLNGTKITNVTFFIFNDGEYTTVSGIFTNLSLSYTAVYNSTVLAIFSNDSGYYYSIVNESGFSQPQFLGTSQANPVYFDLDMFIYKNSSVFYIHFIGNTSTAVLYNFSDAGSESQLLEQPQIPGYWVYRYERENATHYIITTYIFRGYQVYAYENVSIKKQPAYFILYETWATIQKLKLFYGTEIDNQTGDWYIKLMRNRTTFWEGYFFTDLGIIYWKLFGAIIYEDHEYFLLFGLDQDGREWLFAYDITEDSYNKVLLENTSYKVFDTDLDEIPDSATVMYGTGLDVEIWLLGRIIELIVPAKPKPTPYILITGVVIGIIAGSVIAAVIGHVFAAAGLGLLGTSFAIALITGNTQLGILAGLGFSPTLLPLFRLRKKKEVTR